MRKQFLIVETDATLKRHYVEQWHFTRQNAIKRYDRSKEDKDKLSSRGLLKAMSVTFARANAEGYVFKWRGVDATYPLPELDTIYHPDMRWLRDYLMATDDGIPKRDCVKLECLRVQNLFLKYEYPEFRDMFEQLVLND